MTNPSGVDFSLPLHHKPEGPTDPTKIKLPNPFVVVVAGASRGIGAGIARSYAKGGASGIILCGRQARSLEDVSTEISKINSTCKVLCQECDITSENDVQNLLKTTENEFHRIDVLAINAGAGTRTTETRNGKKDWPAGFIEGPPSELDRLWKLNVYAPYLLMHSFLPLLESTKDGAQAVIQLSSSAAHYTKADLMPMSYSLTKFSVTRMIELCHEGHAKNGISAYALQPGGVLTGSGGLPLPEGKGWEKRECF
jgi:NAD(P)-dependent dehydrogenase (short-subunit alcohol dehydrogenase family)